MAIINPYLTFTGNCEEAFTFYKSVFGGEFSYIGRFDEMPKDVDHGIAKDDKNKIMHISLPISKETVLMERYRWGMGHKKYCGHQYFHCDRSRQ